MLVNHLKVALTITMCDVASFTVSIAVLGDIDSFAALGYIIICFVFEPRLWEMHSWVFVTIGGVKKKKKKHQGFFLCDGACDETTSLDREAI